MTYISWSSDFAFKLVSWRLFDVWTSLFGIMNHFCPNIWPQNKCRSLWPIFHSPVILPYVSKTIWWMSHIFRQWDRVTQTLTSKEKKNQLWHEKVLLFPFSVERPKPIRSSPATSTLRRTGSLDTISGVGSSYLKGQWPADIGGLHHTQQSTGTHMVDKTTQVQY